MAPDISDLKTKIAEYVSTHINLDKARDYFGDELESMSDDGLRKWLKERLIKDDESKLYEWFAELSDARLETLSRITYYALEIPELGISATIQYTHDENTSSDTVEVVHVDCDEEDYNESNGNVEDLLLELFDNLL